MYIYILYNPLPIRGRSQQVQVIIQLVHWSCHPPVYTGPPGAAMLHVCFTIIYLRLGPCWGYNKSVANINRSLRDDRTLFSLSIIMFSKGNHPQMAQHFRFMNHLIYQYIYIYVVWATATYTIYDLWISRWCTLVIMYIGFPYNLGISKFTQIYHMYVCMYVYIYIYMLNIW